MLYNINPGAERGHAPVKPPPDRTHRLAALPAIPDLGPLRGRIVDATTVSHAEHSIFAQRLECCVHPLRPPPKRDTLPNHGHMK